MQSGADFNVLPIQMDISMESSASRGNFVSELYIKGDDIFLDYLSHLMLWPKNLTVNLNV